MILDSFQFQLCDIQGRLFELSVKQGYDSAKFMEAFMTGRCAFALDDIYDRLQWAGEEYILEELNDEVGGLVKSDNIFSIEVMFWTGYLYRYWHFYTGQSSKDIYGLVFIFNNNIITALQHIIQYLYEHFIIDCITFNKDVISTNNQYTLISFIFLFLL